MATRQPAKKAARAVAGGPDKYEHQSEWKATEIVGARRKGGGMQYRIAWEGYDQSYDTWEAAEDVLDKRLIASFEKTIDMSFNLQQPLYEMRNDLAERMMKMKHAEANVEVAVPLAALAPIARALFALARRPPSRRGIEPLQVEYTENTRWKTTQLQLDEPEDVAWLLQLHLVRPGNGYGCAIIKKGHAGNHNITIFGGPVVLSYYEPVQPFKPGHYFSIAGNVWVFNGSTGALLPSPGLPNASMHKPLAEYLKGVLRGRKAWGLKHKLIDNGWAELPPTQLEQAVEVAMPKAKVKRARKGACTGGEKPPKMGKLDA